MKIQCTCGAKFTFDVTPEMALPVQFVCPSCGLDISEPINQLVQSELAPGKMPEPFPIIASPAPTIEVPPPPQPTSSSAPRLRINLQNETKPGETASETPNVSGLCLKHPGQSFVDRCIVCKKPICPKCMEEFGYLCSPFCKAKAENRSMDVPVYAGQKTVVEAKYWRKVGLISAGIALVVVAFFGLWIWYAWVGSVPSVKYSISFSEAAYSGESAMPEKNQLVFLHGATLARHDVKQKKEIWSRSLAAKGDDDAGFAMGFGGQARLRVRGHNIWVEFPNKLVRYDWDSGKPVQEIANKTFGDLISRNDEVQMIGFAPGKYTVTHVNLASAESRTEEVNAAATPALTLTQGSRKVELAGLPAGSSAAGIGQPLDPAAVEAHIQSLSTPAKIALPAVLAANYSQERIFNELAEQEGEGSPRAPAAAETIVRERASFVPTKNGQIQFRVRLLERKIVEHVAMKDPPKKSALDGTVNQAATDAIANELLNEMQRNRGGNKILEDESRYQITLHRLDVNDAPDWKGEVIGPPSLYPLETVNVVTANMIVMVFDKLNKKIWESKLTFNVPGNNAALDPADAPDGLGPCVERNGTLYVADMGVLTAFDVATGNARWRLPTVGVSGLFFGDDGMIYINTTTANPDSVKYSRQIDLTRKTETLVLKVDPATGKTLWSAKKAGYVGYVSGKFLYTIGVTSGGGLGGMVSQAVLMTKAYLGLRRLDPKNGRILWEYFQQRAPLDVKFDRNSIQLIFDKELQVLRYLTF